MERKVTEYMEEVKLPDMRNELIFSLLNLSDAKYQQCEWIEKRHNYPDKSFGSHLLLYCDFIEDCGIFDYVDQKKVPYECVGSLFKSEQEAEVLYKVAEYFDLLQSECVTNVEYLSSPCLPKLRVVAKEAFDIFMENERDDKEFCERVERFKKERADVVAIRTGAHGDTQA